MKTLALRMATAILALTAFLAVVATPAHAADDEIRNLSVTYAIGSGGSGFSGGSSGGGGGGGTSSGSW